jgi:hypothetical protein
MRSNVGLNNSTDAVLSVCHRRFRRSISASVLPLIYKAMADDFASELASRLGEMAYSPPRFAPGVIEMSHCDHICFAPPSRAEILEAISLVAVSDGTTESKVNGMQRQLNVVLRLLLSKYSSSPSPRFSSGTPSPTLANGSRDASRGPPANFVCPVCHEPLTEKAFVRHIQKWPTKAAGGRVRKGSCPGIRSLSHPLLQHFDEADGIVGCVQQLVDGVCKLTEPGSYRAHSSDGTGNDSKVNAYFAALQSK